MKPRDTALLVLDDGRIFRGSSYGKQGMAVGTVRVNSASTGYQELFTDEASKGAILVMTWPHIGNTGINEHDNHSDTYWPAGIVVRDPARRASHWQATGELEEALEKAEIVGICEVDTRALTRHLRDHEVRAAGIFSGAELAHGIDEDSPELAALIRTVREHNAQGKDEA